MNRDNPNEVIDYARRKLADSRALMDILNRTGVVNVSLPPPALHLVVLEPTAPAIEKIDQVTFTISRDVNGCKRLVAQFKDYTRFVA